MSQVDLQLSWVHFSPDAGPGPVDDFLDAIGKVYAAQVNAIQLRVAAMGMVVAGQKRKVDKLEDDLWELRAHVRGRSFRLLFFQHGNLLVALHGFEKKTNAPISEQDKSTARQRRQVWLGQQATR